MRLPVNVIQYDNGENMKKVNVKEISRKSFWILALLVILYGIQHFINFLSYDYRGPSGLFVKLFAGVGLEENLSRFILWDILQIAITFICFTLFFRKTLKELGFNLLNLKAGMVYISRFFLVYPLIVAAIWFVIYRTAGSTALTGGVSDQPISYMVKDILVYSLLPGFGEEPLFRVFVIQILLTQVFRGTDLSDGSTRKWLIFISSAFFAYGHIYITSWAPFQVSLNVLQLVAAFALGIFYANTYIRTKSILPAVVCHNYSDFISRLGSYILFYFIK